MGAHVTGVRGDAANLGDIDALVDRVFGINVRGTLTVQKLLPLISNGGSIILNGSVVTAKGIPGHTVYSASKTALRSFARTWGRRTGRPQHPG